MTFERDRTALTARTVLLDGPVDLLDEMDADRPLAFIRTGDGVVGRGEVARLEYSGPNRIAEASEAWRSISAAATVHDDLHLPGTGLLAFGSFAFADESEATSLLIVPSVVIGRRGSTGWVTRIEVTGGGAAGAGHGARAPGVGTGAAQPRQAAAAGAALPARFRPGRMTPERYASAVEAAVAGIAAGRARKVVIARDMVADIPAADSLREPIRRIAQGYPDTFSFAVDGLIGSSPETLVRSEGARVSARVLAGSAARGADDRADSAIEQALLTSEKDLAEHAFALRSVLDALGPRSIELTASDHPFALELPNLWHLASDIAGTLDTDASALDLVAALHPTAAVAGDPTHTALEMIGELEPFDRGRYSGPIGWVDGDGDGEWAVALRCAQVSRNTDGTRHVTAYAGAGIVAASDPQQELSETELKLRPALGAF